MKFLKYFLISIVIIALALLLVGYFAPEKVEVKETRLIKEPAEKIYYYVADLKTWGEWDPWSKKDPNMQVEYAGPERMEGMRRSWESDNKEVGSGTMRIIQAVEFNTLAFSLNFQDEGQAMSIVDLKEVEGGTEMTWSMEFEVGSNIFMKLMGLMMKGAIASDYNTGMDNLAEYLKGQPNPYPGEDFTLEEGLLPYQYFIATRLRDVKREDLDSAKENAHQTLLPAAKNARVEVLSNGFIRWTASSPAEDIFGFDYLLPVSAFPGNELSAGVAMVYDSSVTVLHHLYTGDEAGLNLSMDSVLMAAKQRKYTVVPTPLTHNNAQGQTDIYLLVEKTID